MFRKLTLALAATVAIGVAALSPTTASAGGGGGWKGGWHGHHGYHGWHSVKFGFGPVFAAGGYCYTVKRVVPTPYGPRLRRVTVCE